MTPLRNISHLVLLVALSAFAWLPLATPGYFMRAHDAPHSLFFLQAFDEAIRDGHWGPAWGPHFAFGYGYPLWIFYAPLTYYLGEAFHLLGASITTAMKLVDLLATLGATLAMYGWARRHFDKPAAAFAALTYTYAPYHLLDLYVRSAVAEYATFVFFPLVLWRWEALCYAPSRRNALLAALTTAALILTHHGAAFIFAGLLSAYLLFLLARLWRMGSAPSWASLFAHAVAASTLTLGLSAIFWVPMLLEQRYIVVEQWTSVAYNYQKHFVFANQFFSPFWGYGYSGEGLADEMAFQLGLMPVVCAIVVVLFGLRDPQRRAHSLFFACASVVVALLMSPASAPFWNATPIAALVQFPWRLLALSTVTLAWLAGAAIQALADARTPDTNAQMAKNIPAALLMLVTAAVGFGYTVPQYTERSVTGESARASVDFELMSYKDRTGYMTWASTQPQSSPLVEEYRSGKPLTRAIVLRGRAQVEPLHYGGELHRVRVRADEEAAIQFRVYYFPGWRASIDGKPAALYPAGAQALNTLDVPPGEHLVELRFTDTTTRSMAKGITLVSLLAMMGWILADRFRGGRGVNGAAARKAGIGALVLLLTGSLLVACEGNDAATPTTVAPATPTDSAILDTPTPMPTSTPTATTVPPTATVTPTPRPAVVQHTVQSNETLGAIALQYGVSIDVIMRANNISDPRLIRAGQVLNIPLPTPTPTPTVTATPDPRVPTLPPTPTPNVYVIQPGDVLSAIAAKFNIPVDEIMAANGMTDTFLRAGQSLIIPAPTPTPTVTPTPLPTSTPTPGLSFSAPSLLFPPDGAVLTDTQPIVLNWTAVGALAADQYYVLRLRTADGAPRSESIWLKTPSYRLPVAWRGGSIEWDVIILQLIRTNPDGTREGKIQSPFSQTRQFTWR